MMAMTLQEAIAALVRAGHDVAAGLGGNSFAVEYPRVPGEARRQELMGAVRLIEVAEGIGIQSEPEPKFGDAPDVEEIARVLIPRHHGHLVEAQIRYLWRYGPWESRGQKVLGKCYRLSARDEFLTGFHFLIMINWPAWQDLDPEQRTALVDHELCHAGQDHDADGNPRWCIWNHDVEEFSAIIDRHGLWRPALDTFGRAAAPHMTQLQFGLDQVAAAGGNGEPTVTITSGGRSVTTDLEGIRRAADELELRRRLANPPS